MPTEPANTTESRRNSIENGKATISSVLRSIAKKPWHLRTRYLDEEKAAKLFSAAADFARQDAFEEKGVASLHRDSAKAIKDAPTVVKAGLAMTVLDRLVELDKAVASGDDAATEDIRAVVGAAEFLSLERSYPHIKRLLDVTREDYQMPKLFTTPKGRLVTRRRLLAAGLGVGGLYATYKAGEVIGGIKEIAKNLSLRPAEAATGPSYPLTEPSASAPNSRPAIPAASPAAIPSPPADGVGGENKPAAPVGSPSPEPAKSPTPERVEVKGSLSELIMQVLFREALKKREAEPERMRTTNPELAKRGFGLFIGGVGFEVRLGNHEEFTDTNLVAFFNMENRSITIANILRDTDVPKLPIIKRNIGFGTVGFESVNQSYEVGRLEHRQSKGGGVTDKDAERPSGFLREKDVMTEIVGIDDLNMHLTIEGAVDTVASVFGKIPITAMEDVDDVQKSEDGNTVYWEIHVKKGQTYEMDGEQLVHYMQSRAASERNRNHRIQQVLDVCLDTAKKRFTEASKVEKLLLLGRAGERLFALQREGKLTADFDINATLGEVLKTVAAAISLGQAVPAGDPKLKKIVMDEDQGLKIPSELQHPKAIEHYRDVDNHRRDLRVLDADPTDPNYAGNYWTEFRRAFQKLALS